MTQQAELTIIGGGITGLATAYIAAKQGVKVKVIEASKDFGGLLNTFEIGVNRLEYFYHHFFTHDAEIHWLVKELGIESKLIYKKTTMGTFRNNHLYPFNGAMDLLKFKPIKFIGKIRWGLTSLYLGKIAKWQNYENVTALEWFYENAGESATNSIWKPMLDIKFGPYADKIPLSWMIGRLRQRLNSRKSGDERLGYLQGGLDTLLQALLAKLNTLGVELINEAPATAINMNPDDSIRSVVTNKGTFEGGKFLFTIPGSIVGKLLPPFSATKDKLDAVNYFGAVCVILETPEKISNTYWINVADPGFDFGGIIEHTNFIEPEHYQGKHITYLSRYFDLNDSLFHATDEQISGKMIPQLKLIFPKFDLDSIQQVRVFRTSFAATVCDLNFSQKIIDCETEFANLYIANMAHIYPDERSVNNSIRVAAEACRVMGYNSVKVPEGSSLSGKIGFGENQ
ncbi:MAG: NAD(P)/FAD-dependent oxidoreductase [Bacteroidia bacterium]|nr:NAD(P)/FAD-dependent oxidoreductase [Bacteroidia bacterium]MCO5255009.1 NAD(P)/FAD-dependent oxidoreductase [Bacteroidota bacterium]